MRGIFILSIILILVACFELHSQNLNNKIDIKLHIAYSQYLKKDGHLKKIKTFYNDPYKLVKLIKGIPIIPVHIEFINKLENKSELQIDGLRFNSIIEKYATAELNLFQLYKIASRPEIKCIEAACILEPELDISRTKVQCDQAHTSFGYKGSGVIVGIVDDGFDVYHDDFKGSDGTTRILAYWDQYNEYTGIGKPSDYNYGSLWQKTNIDNHSVEASSCGNSSGHGTHVTGIAVGRHGTYMGMAPEADILLVRFRRLLDDVGGDLEQAYSTDIIDAISWIGKEAKNRGNKPWVVNLSIGANWGPKDGSSIFEKTIASIATNENLGKGRIIVKSAGNQGYHKDDPNKNDRKEYKWHCGDDIASNQFIYIGSSDDFQNIYKDEQVKIEIWYPKTADYTITLYGPNGGVYGPYSEGQYTIDTDLKALGFIYDAEKKEGLVLISNNYYNDFHEDHYKAEKSKQIQIILLEDEYYRTSAGVLASGIWEIELESSAGGHWDAYIPERKKIYNSDVYFDIDDDSYTTTHNCRTITEPGNANNVITVGSFNSAPRGNSSDYPEDQINYHSSLGPSRNTDLIIQKPEIFAPGALIISTKSFDFSGSSYGDANHCLMFGTSMAAPHVTGAVALLLQQSVAIGQNWGYNEILTILDEKKTSNGYLDIYAALSKYGAVGIEDEIEIYSGPQILNQNSSSFYYSRFLDYDPLGDYIVGPWSWELHANHSSGDIILSNGTSNGSYSTVWQCFVPTLNTYENSWTRDENKRIKGYIKCFATDNDYIGHVHELPIGINAVPNAPILYQTDGGVGTGQIKLSFIGGGAENYKIYYDTDSGEPYSGTGATQGVSPIIVSASVTQITLSGLTSGTTYYFAIKAINSIGESDYSIEQYATPITTTGTLTSNEEWPGVGNPSVINLSGNVIIPTGKTLAILDGATVKLKSNGKLTVNSGGHIYANGGFNNIKFERYDESTSWDRIELYGADNQFSWCVFDGGNYNVDVRSRGNSFTHCTFKNAERGFNAYKRSDNSWASFSMDNCMVENNHYGVVASATYAAINNCTMQNNTSYGLGLVNARIGNNVSYGSLCGLFTHNFIQNNDIYGIDIFSNGVLWLGYGTTPGNNKIINNDNHEIYINSSETARLYEATNGGYGYITDVVNEFPYFIYNLGKTWQNEQWVLVQVSAQNNYWGPNGIDIDNFYGPVDYTPYLTTDPTGTPGASGYPSRLIPGDDSGEGEMNDSYVLTSLNSTAGVPVTDDDSKTTDEKVKALESDIKSDPNNPENAGKLNEIYHLQVDYDPEDKSSSKKNTMDLLAGYRDALMKMDEKTAQENPDSAAAVQINGETSMILEMYDANFNCDYKQTLQLVKKYDSYIKNSDSRREYLSLKLTAYEFTDQYEEALTTLNELKKEVQFDGKEYTTPVYDTIEENLLEQLGRIKSGSAEKFGSDAESDFLTASPQKFALHNNYPNPFNPETKIPFSLLNDSHVKLEVYNMLGQKVATLADKVYQSGNHLERFNAANMASGIYFVVIQIETINESSSSYVFKRKMVFLK
jgi:subtilisin family serine protease